MSTKSYHAARLRRDSGIFQNTRYGFFLLVGFQPLAVPPPERHPAALYCPTIRPPHASPVTASRLGRYLPGIPIRCRNTGGGGLTRNEGRRLHPQGNPQKVVAQLRRGNRGPRRATQPLVLPRLSAISAPCTRACRVQKRRGRAGTLYSQIGGEDRIRTGAFVPTSSGSHSV
jgi:hypothetical protein